MNNYLILSNDTVMIQEDISEIVKKSDSDVSVINYDLSVSSLADVIEELNTYSFLTSHKIVVIRNCFFLTREGKKGEASQDVSLLEEYLNSPNPQNTLIIVANQLDERKKITKLIRNKCQKMDPQLPLDKWIQKKLEGYVMDPAAMRNLIAYSKEDRGRILRELDKIKLYKAEEKRITVEDINLLVPIPLEDDIFTLTNAIAEKNREKSLEKYRSLLASGEDVVRIVIATCDQIRLIYKVKLLMLENKKKEEIISILKIHPYRVELSMQSARRFSEEELLKNLKLLGQLDIKMKTGKTANANGFDLFLFNLEN